MILYNLLNKGLWLARKRETKFVVMPKVTCLSKPKYYPSKKNNHWLYAEQVPLNSWDHL